jgi:hypothetical protein
MLWRWTKIVLCENDKIVNNTKDVTECFNNFFSTVASSIGKDVNYDPLQHPSIVEIKKKMEIESEKSFVFQKVTEQKVEKNVSNINIRTVLRQNIFLSWEGMQNIYFLSCGTEIHFSIKKNSSRWQHNFFFSYNVKSNFFFGQIGH